MLVIPEILLVSPSPAQWSMWGCDFRGELQPPVSLAMTVCGAQGQGMWQRGR